MKNVFNLMYWSDEFFCIQYLLLKHAPWLPISVLIGSYITDFGLLTTF